MASSSDEEPQKGIIEIVKDTALLPVHIATSRTARRAYINTALLLLSSAVLAGFAATGYTLFYYAYIPTRGFSLPVHLQFSPSLPAPHHPYGVAPTQNYLVSGQAYDVRVVLSLPHSQTNKDAGNFMLDLALLAPPVSGVGAAVESVLGTSAAQPDPEVLARSSRPAILTYYSPAVEHVHKAVQLPWYVLGWRTESETLAVPMLEGVVFEKGWRNLPASVRLEVQSVQRLQLYGVRVEFEAKLRGLRYIMYNWRITSFLVFTVSFWAVEMTFMLLAWVVLSHFFAVGPQPLSKRELEEDRGKIKTEEEETELEDTAELSDTSRTFPSYTRQPSLRYSSPRVKKEEGEEETSPMDILPAAMEADDEDEDADFVIDESGRHMDRDSGLGTSMDSGADRREAVRRRRSGLFSSGSRNA